MTPAQHAHYWVTEFRKRLNCQVEGTPEWHKINKLLSNAVMQWRVYAKLRLVKK